MDYLDKSIKLLQVFEPLALQSDSRGYCVCSSFGKDSVALIRVFKLAKVKFWVKWNITGIDPPELVYFARKQIQKLKDDGVYVFKQMYEKSMFRMIIEHKIPPNRVFRYCCDELKEKEPNEHKTCYHSFGVRKCESNSREGRNELELIHKNKERRMSLEYTQQANYQVSLYDTQDTIYLNGDNHENRKQFENCLTKGVRAVNPLVYWHDGYLWDFIHSEKIPYCELYDEGFTRLGCIGCPMAGKGRIREFERYPKFYNYYLSAFEKMLIRRKEDKVDERRIIEGKKPMGWESPQDVMDWWLEVDHDHAQMNLFDVDIY